MACGMKNVMPSYQNANLQYSRRGKDMNISQGDVGEKSYLDRGKILSVSAAVTGLEAYL